MPIPQKKAAQRANALYRGHVVVENWKVERSAEENGKLVPKVFKAKVVEPEALAGKTLFFESPVIEKDGTVAPLIDRAFMNKTKGLKRLILERATIYENEGQSADAPVKARNIGWVTATDEGRYLTGIVTKEMPGRVTVLEDRLYDAESGVARYAEMLKAYEAKKEQLRASGYVSASGKEATGEAAPRPAFAIAVLDEANVLHGFFPPTSSRYPVHVSGETVDRNDKEVVRTLGSETVSVEEVKNLASELENYARTTLGVETPRITFALGQSVRISSESFRGEEIFESATSRVTPCLPDASWKIAARSGFRGAVTVNPDGIFATRVLPEQKTAQGGVISYNHPLAAFSEVSGVSERLKALNEAAKARRAEWHKAEAKAEEEVDQAPEM